MVGSSGTLLTAIPPKCNRAGIYPKSRPSGTGSRLVSPSTVRLRNSSCEGQTVRPLPSGPPGALTTGAPRAAAVGRCRARTTYDQAKPQNNTSIVGKAPSRATEPTTVVGYILIPVQASDPFIVALLVDLGGDLDGDPRA